MMKLILLVAAAAVCLPQERAETLWRRLSAGAIEEAVAIPASSFSEANVVRMCRSFLATQHEAKVVRYLLVTDAQEALNHLRGPGLTDMEFPFWRIAYQAQPQRMPATAELVRIRDRAAVRMRFLDGRIVERVLEQGNPFKMEFQGETTRILGVAPSYTNPPRGVSPSTVEFFVQTPRPWTLRTAEGFSRMFRAYTGLRWIVITIEDGWWFAGASNYPIYNRFLPYLEPPTLEEFKQHHRFICVEGDGTCSQTGPARQ